MTRAITSKTAAICATAFLALAGLTACSSAGTTGSAPSSAAAGGPYKIAVTAGAKIITNWDAYIADAKGYYRDHNVVVSSVTAATAANANQLLFTGQVQIGAGLTPMIESLVGGQGAYKLVDVADTLIRPAFVLNARPDIKSAKDLVGKNVGIVSATDPQTIVTIDALHHLGVEKDQVKLAPGGASDARLAGLVAGSLDASLLFPPVSSQAESQGFHSLGYIPDMLGDNYLFSYGTIVVNPNWASADKNALDAYLAARNDALKFLNDPKNKDEAIQILATATNIDKTTATDIYNTLHIATPQSAFAPDVEISRPAVQGTLDAMRLAGQDTKNFKVSDLVDDSYAAEAQRG